MLCESNYPIKKVKTDLAGRFSLVELCPLHRNVGDSIPRQATCLGYGFDLQWEYV